MFSKKTICLVILLALLPLIFSSCRKAPDPKKAVAYIGKGLAKHNLKDYYGAIKEYNLAIEVYPKSAGAYYYRGFAKAELKDNPGAIQDYTQAIQLYPTYAVAYLNRGIANLKLGVRQAGCKDLKKAQKLGDARADDLLKAFCK